VFLRARVAPLLAALTLAACAGEPAERPSVLLISADSLRTDRLAPWNVVDAPATPHLDRLAARGTVYLDAWATSPWTAPAMVSVLTGLYPPSHGIAYRDDTTPQTLPTLPRILAGHGYRLGNFSFFSEISYFRNLGLGSPVEDLRHETVAASFRRWLAEVPAGEPFFAWVHLLETHLPYGATGYRATEVQVEGSPGLREAQLRAAVPLGSVEFADGDRDVLLELYDRDVREMDGALGEVLDALGGYGRTAGTVIVFVADHGEELLEYGWIGHASTASFARLVPEILRVPLILAGPGVPAGAVRHERVQQVDVVPSVLRLARVDPPEPLDGRPLPGLFRDWLGRTGAGRELAFFDSSPGGNLTPQSRRGERLQGVTDGRCLLEAHAYPDRPEDVRTYAVAEPEACGPQARERLAAELDRWRRRQTAQRLTLLAAYPGAGAPKSAEVDGYAGRLEIVAPRPGAVLEWEAAGGQVALEWTGGGGPYWLEYHLGEGLTSLRGSFQLDQRRVVFGPVPQGFWNDLAVYSPFRVRIVDAGARERSPWVEFDVRTAAPR
jgi:hypothetical protein